MSSWGRCPLALPAVALTVCIGFSKFWGLAVLLCLPFRIRRPFVAGALVSKYTVLSTAPWHQ